MARTLFLAALLGSPPAAATPITFVLSAAGSEVTVLSVLGETFEFSVTYPTLTLEAANAASARNEFYSNGIFRDASSSVIGLVFDSVALFAEGSVGRESQALVTSVTIDGLDRFDF